jgi:hypothetical protein
MDFDLVQTTLKTWVSTLAGINVAMVKWEGEPLDRILPPGVTAECSWVSITGMGQDETRWTVDSTVPAPGNNATASTVTMRVVVLQISFETFDQRASTKSRQYAENLRQSIYMPSSADTLRAANLKLIDAFDSRQADYWVDQRKKSRTLLEVRFNLADVRVDTASERGTIEHIVATSQLLGADGNPLATPLQVTNKVMP